MSFYSVMSLETVWRIQRGIRYDPFPKWANNLVEEKRLDSPTTKYTVHNQVLIIRICTEFAGGKKNNWLDLQAWKKVKIIFGLRCGQSVFRSRFQAGSVHRSPFSERSNLYWASTIIRGKISVAIFKCKQFIFKWVTWQMRLSLRILPWVFFVSPTWSSPNSKKSQQL